MAAAAEGISIANSVRTKSLADLVAAQRQLSDQIQAEGVITGGYTIDINPSETTQALAVNSQSTDFDHTAVPDAGSKSEGLDLYKKKLTKDLGVLVDIKLDETGPPVPASTRQNDSPPLLWWTWAQTT